MASVAIKAFGAALRTVVGGKLKQSELGEVWHDQQTWEDIAREVFASVASKHAIVDKDTYAKVVADAAQMGEVRRHLKELTELRKKSVMKK